jgi:hypothetical protein
MIKSKSVDFCKIKIPFIDVFYHQSLERHPGHNARAPPITHGDRVRNGDQTTTICKYLHTLGQDINYFAVVLHNAQSRNNIKG